MTEVKKTRSIGLKTIQTGTVNPVGGMPEDLKSLGKTFKGTASFNTENDQTQDFYSEENPTAPGRISRNRTGRNNSKEPDGMEQPGTDQCIWRFYQNCRCDY